MLALLLVTKSKKTEKYAGAVAGVLIMLYLTFEEPYSGMSLNPARSFASAFAAREWKDLWIYFTAPPFAMLLAAQVFLWRYKTSEMLPQHPAPAPEPAPEEEEAKATESKHQPISFKYGATPLK